jgi:NAD(P)-dependent dehydrogenase (short-subunit alcohol dehydrogenase family)
LSKGSLGKKYDRLKRKECFNYRWNISYSPSHKVITADFDRVIAVNLRGAYLCVRETIKYLLSVNHRGAIVYISSVHEIIGRPMYISYSISKGSMENLTKTLALEYASQGIRVNALRAGKRLKGKGKREPHN